MNCLFHLQHHRVSEVKHGPCMRVMDTETHVGDPDQPAGNRSSDSGNNECVSMAENEVIRHNELW